ncbi:MAG: trehalose-phosphatase [Parvularculaceae bacterium]|nr:trehalose-phosphatase [Parvularculaceae bacterium]
MTTRPAPGLLTNRSALFLDFDGTLSPLQDDPDAVALPEGGGEVLQALAQKLGGAVALVSGRDARDLSKRVPLNLWRVGNHGDIELAPGKLEPDMIQEPPTELLAAAKALCDSLPGVRLEQKARVMAIHTRHAREHAEAVATGLAALVAERDNYKLQQGKDVAELKPLGIHKGVAIERLMAQSPFAGRKPLFLGDDTTDEDGFRTCLQLNGSAIKVGEGDTGAPYRLSGPDEVWTFLKGALHDLA